MLTVAVRRESPTRPLGPRVASGIVAGVAGGIIFGMLATVMTEPMTGNGLVTLMLLLARTYGSDQLLPAWFTVLAVAAVLGAVFGLLAGGRERDAGALTAYGLVYAVVVGALVGLVGVPLLLGLPPVAGAQNRAVWPWLPGTQTACLLFSSVLTVTFIWLSRRRPAEPMVSEQRDRGR